ncbi:MAG TPA: tetratricopeptide repeat protein [Xanthobacteraceae bacterium]
MPVATPARAQQSQNLKRCSGEITVSFDQRNLACSELIKAAGDLPVKLSYVYCSRGNAFQENKQLDLAIADYDEAVKLDPESYLGYLCRGNGYQARGQFDQAIADYNRAIELNSSLAGAFSGRGIAYRFKGDYDRAIADYT